MSHTSRSLATRILFEVFDQRDAAKRQAAIAELFTEDCVFIDHHGTNRGHAALDRAAALVQGNLPGFAFSEVGESQSVGNVARLAWSFGPKDQPRKITGLDVIVERDGKVAALYTFLDPPNA